jgi:hypothetical protein
MRKTLLLLLLAGAATPALAAGDPGDRHRDRDGDKSESSEPRHRVRVERSDNGDQSNAPAFSRRNSDSGERPQVFVRGNGGNGGNDGNDGARAEFRRQRLERVQQQPAESQASSEEVRTFRGNRQRVVRPPVVNDEVQVVRQQDGSRRLRQTERALPNVMRTRVPVVSQVPREGTQPPLRVQQRARRDNVVHAEWRSSWRNNHRYDWQDHRRRHRSIFHIGVYFDPFGWGYRPYSIGWRLWPSYYSSRYWINDPWQYRLPYAPPGYRWIRYWNDAVLVDTWTGEVVDVVYNFFW